MKCMRMTIVAAITAMMLCRTSYAVDLKVYESTDKGFQPTGETLTLSEDPSGNYYSINDIKGITDCSITEGFSTMYFHGSYYNRIYDVPVINITIGDNTYEINSNITVNDGRVTHYDNDLMVTYDGETYVSKDVINNLIPNMIITDASASYLSDNTDYTKFLDKGNLNTEKKNYVTQALWVMFNTYKDGYDIILNNVTKLTEQSYTTMVRESGLKNVTAYIWFGYYTVYIDKDKILEFNPERLGALLLHEATHIQVYKDHHDMTEIPTVYNECMSLKVMKDVGYKDTTYDLEMVMLNYTYCGGSYLKGVNAFQSYIDAEEGIQE